MSATGTHLLKVALYYGTPLPSCERQSFIEDSTVFKHFSVGGFVEIRTFVSRKRISLVKCTPGKVVGGVQAPSTSADGLQSLVLQPVEAVKLRLFDATLNQFNQVGADQCRHRSSRLSRLDA